MFKRISVIPYIIFVAFAIGGCRSSTDLSTEPTWQEVESPTTKDLYSVFAISEDNAWAVGDSGVITHWDGSEWNIVQSSTRKKLNGIYFVNADNGWAVGNNGTILYWNGSVWVSDSSPVTVNLNDVQFLSQNEGWAVGDYRTVIHYSEGSWTLVYGQGSIPQHLLSLYFLSSMDGWIVGRGKVLRYQNGSWSILDTLFYGDLYSVFFVNNTNGWAVGEEAIDSPMRRARVLHYDGSGWQNIPLHNPPYSLKQNYWFSVFFVNEDEGWIAGAENADIEKAESMLHYKEEEWSIVNIDDYRTIYSLYFLNAQNGWAVGRDGYILRFCENSMK